MPAQLLLEVQPRFKRLRWSSARLAKLSSIAGNAVSSFTQGLETPDPSELTKTQQIAISQAQPPTVAVHKYGENYQALVIYRIYKAFLDSVVIDVNVSMMFGGRNASEQVVVPDDFDELRSCCNRLVAELARHLSSWDRNLSVSVKFADVYSKPTGIEARPVTFLSRLRNTMVDALGPILGVTVAGLSLVVKNRVQTGNWNLSDEILLVLLTFVFTLITALVRYFCHLILKKGELDYYVTT